MSYARQDFSESMSRTTITPDKIESVIAAWGESTEGYGEWSGGFVMKLKDGRFAYLTGWCDTTGWGCQDGASIEYFDKKPKFNTFKKSTWAAEDELLDWDINPADLNKWLAEGAETDKVY
jgi:hypothetical protein